MPLANNSPRKSLLVRRCTGQADRRRESSAQNGFSAGNTGLDLMTCYVLHGKSVKLVINLMQGLTDSIYRAIIEEGAFVIYKFAPACCSF